MKLKRLTSLFLALLSCFSFSCGGTGGDPDTTGQTNTDESTTAEYSEYQKPDVNYGGAKFRVMEIDPVDVTWQASKYFDIRALEETGDPLNDALFRRNRMVEEALGIELEFVNNSVDNRTQDADANIRANIMAADDFTDIIMLNGRSYRKLLAEEGMLMNLRDIGTVDMDASWWDKGAVEAFTFGNTIKVMTGDISLYSSFAPMLLFMNKNVAEMYDLENCYDLVRSGKWTYDVMKEMCVAVAADLNGDSIMDENDRFGMAEQAGLVGDMLTSCGVKYTDRDSSGKLYPALNTEKTASLVAEFVTFLNDNSTNCCAGKYQGKYSNVFYDLHIPMFKNDQILFNYQQLLIAFELRAMDADYGLIPFPKYDEAQETYLTSTSNSWNTFVSVPATVRDTERIGYVLDSLGFYSKQMVTPEFIDTTVRKKTLRDEDSAEMLGIILDNIVYDIAFVYDWGELRSMVNMMGYMNGKNFASRWAKAEEKIKTEMNETLNMLG